LTEVYQRIFVVAMSVFYAVLTLVGLFNLPALLVTYFPKYVGEALLGFCLLMLALYALTLIAIFWED